MLDANNKIQAQHAVTFVGPIRFPATKSLRNLICQLAGQGAKKIILQISSDGGSLFEGFALYHFLKSLPVEITVHNIGSVEGIALAVFLAAKNRYCCKESRFLFTAFDWTYSAEQTLLPERMKEHSLLIDFDEARFLEILKRETSISDKSLDHLQVFHKATVVDSSSAKKMGLVQGIKESSIPAGCSIWNVDY